MDMENEATQSLFEENKRQWSSLEMLIVEKLIQVIPEWWKFEC